MLSIPFHSSLARSLLAGGAALAILGGLVGLGLWLTGGGFPKPPTTAPNTGTVSAQAIEERWGVRFTQVGVTADGGMIDLRFQVLDPDKALAMIDDVERLPVMVAEGSGQLVNSALPMPARHELAAGRTYFLLYRNGAGAIKPGEPVTVVVGEQRLEHLLAQ
jgi:hypothetical protein